MVQKVMKLNGVGTANFHQCQFGLVSKVGQKPMRKSTRLLTNVPQVISRFDQVWCRGEHVHEPICGTEGGERRSSW